MNTSYLVNIVANDFKDGQSIFEPFCLDTPSARTNGHVLNGDANGVVGTIKSALHLNGH